MANLLNSAFFVKHNVSTVHSSVSIEYILIISIINNININNNINNNYIYKIDIQMGIGEDDYPLGFSIS